jgi:hypothetical protein
MELREIRVYFAGAKGIVILSKNVNYKFFSTTS